MQKGMSKLQIRAEVLLMLQQLSLFDDIPKYEIDKYTIQLKNSEKLDDILEILLKELSRCELKKSQIIAYFLAELGTLEKLKDGLWNYVKAPTSPDWIKDLSGVILKSLGDDATPEELLSYLNNPDELVDKETQKLMEMASVNPEAQIDFLDFLFSLPDDEQINLINTMKDDFSSQHLPNILIPALESNISEKLNAVIIDILGQTRSQYAVSCLNDIKKYSNNENMVKLANKSLNMLKLSGINIETAEKEVLGADICEISNIYKCYASIVDGAGNQGIIIGRKKQNGDIITFSTVINDIDGIIDCFGFYGISNEDYNRIITKFEGELAAVQISPEYGKYKLMQAEQINKSSNSSICYEYLCWKSLIYDIKQMSDEYINENIPKWADNACVDKTGMLFSHPVFNYWFLGEGLSEPIKTFFDEIIQDTVNNKDNYINNPDVYLHQMENKIKQVIPFLFAPDIVKLYKSRLAEVAYLFDIQGIELLSNIAASIVMQITDANEQCNNIIFFEHLLKKSVIEHLLRYQNNLEQEAAPAYTSLWKKDRQVISVDFSSQEIGQVIDILIEAWRKV